MTTYITEPLFRLSSFPSGKAFIVMDTWQGLPCLAGGTLSFEIADGMSWDELDDLLSLMNHKLKHVSFTPATAEPHGEGGVHGGVFEDHPDALAEAA